MSQQQPASVNGNGPAREHALEAELERLTAYAEGVNLEVTELQVLLEEAKTKVYEAYVENRDLSDALDEKDRANRALRRTVQYLRQGDGDTAEDRYEGRCVDLAELLAQPPIPTPWRVEGLVADGTLTIVASEGGAGKSWVSQAFCEAVHTGGSVAGLDCEPGVALYIDAEMGSAMFVGRLRSSGATGREYVYRDAMGLDVSRTDDLAWVKEQIEHAGAKLVILDSLRRLTPSKAENDSDDMAPVIGALAKLARDTGAAMIVIHHKGDGEKLFRGSSAIQNQCDALFGLQRSEDDPEGPLRHLWCPVAKGAKRPRYAPDAADVWFELDPDTGRLAQVEPPDEPDMATRVTAASSVTDEILAALPFRTKDECAKKLSRRTDDPSFRAAWRVLRDSNRLVRQEGGGGGWSLGFGTTTPLLEAAPQNAIYGYEEEQR